MLLLSFADLLGSIEHSWIECMLLRDTKQKPDSQQKAVTHLWEMLPAPPMFSFSLPQIEVVCVRL